MKSKIVVADLFQLSRIDGNEFEQNTQYAKKKKSNAVVERVYAEKINGTSAKSGKKYVVNEELTAEWQKKLKTKMDAKSAQEKFDKLNSASVLSDILSLAASTKKTPVKEAVVVEAKDEGKKEVPASSDKPTGDWDIEDIKDYLKENDIKFHHLTKDKSKLLELI